MANRSKPKKIKDDKQSSTRKKSVARGLKFKKSRDSSGGQKLIRIKKVIKKILPGFVVNTIVEIKRVTWPGRNETAKLTFAVLIFSIIFGSFVAILDFGLDKLFKEIILR